MNIKYNKKKYWALCLFSFLVIYTPNISSNIYINYILPFIYMGISCLFFKKVQKNFKKTGIFFAMTLLIFFWIFGSCFFAIRSLIAGTEITDLVNLRIVQTANIIANIITISRIEQQLTVWRLNTQEKLKFILDVVTIQFIIVILMLIFPNLRTILLNHFYQYGNGNQFTMAKRVYGIMLNYTFSAPIFHGFLASLSLAYSIIYNKKFLVYIPMLVIMIILNGRTGLIVFIIGIIIVFFILITKQKYFQKTCKILFVLLFIILITFSTIKKIKPDTYNFLLSGIQDVINYVLNDEQTGNIGVLLEDFNNNINSYTFMYGNGHRIQNSGDIPKNIIFLDDFSDMGYLNDMYMGGIVYMLILYLPMIYFILFKSKRHSLNNNEKSINNIINLLSISTLFICNIKGEVFRASIIIIIIIYCKLMLFDRKEI